MNVVPLTLAQIEFVLRQASRWLEIKEQEEYVGRKRKYSDGEFSQLRADVSHSALLRRLLSGKEPLEEPPPLEHSYPDYEAVEGKE